jgi:modulator of FtsH protease
MALYDRDYIRNSTSSSATYEQEYSYNQSAEGLRAFIKQTYQLFAASLLAGTVGAYIGLGMPALVQSWYWGFVILELGLLFGIYAVKNKPGINMIVLFAFTFVSGLTIAPLLYTILGMAGGAGIVANAFGLITVAFGGLSLFAMNTKRDFGAMGKMLFITLIVVVVASLINIFTQSPLFQIVIASISAILFSGFILYDTQNIIRGAYSSPIEAAIALYLDFLNLFISLLQILGIFGSSDD